MVVAEAFSTTKIAAAGVALVTFELVLRCLRDSLWQAEGAAVVTMAVEVVLGALPEEEAVLPTPR